MWDASAQVPGAQNSFNMVVLLAEVKRLRSISRKLIETDDRHPVVRFARCVDAVGADEIELAVLTAPEYRQPRRHRRHVVTFAHVHRLDARSDHEAPAWIEGESTHVE